MSLRAVAFGLLAAVLTVLGGAALPAAASVAMPAAGYIDVLPSGGGSPQSNVGLLSVEIGSDQPLTSMTVSLYRPSDNTDVLDLPMADFVTPAHDGDGYYGIWTLSSPITTGQLALGSYSIEVTAASADASISNVYGGTLNFLDEPRFPAFSSSGTTFSLDNQNVTFSGTATLLAPDGTTTPLANADLSLGGPSGPAALVTGADGSFTITVAARQGSYYVYYAGDTDTGYGNSAIIGISVTQFPVQIKAALKVKNPDYQAPDSLTGTVTYTDAGVSKPLAGVTVALVDSGFQTQASAVTDANGSFTMAVPTLSSQTWTVKTTASTYFQAATLSLPMIVAAPNWIRGFRASLSPFAVVKVRGCIRTWDRPVVIEYAKSAQGPWTVLGRVKTFSGLSCGTSPNYGTVFSGRFTAHLTAAYYRAVFVRVPATQAAVSKTVFLKKYLTKITSFDVTPRSVPRNGNVTVSGRLWAMGKAGKWRPYGGKKVMVVFKYNNTWYRYRHEPVTSSTGWFRWQFRVYGTSPFFAQYNGDSTHFASASPRISVTATAQHLATLPRPGGADPVHQIWRGELRVSL